MLLIWVLALVIGAAEMLPAQSGNLEIYWIDVEGGAATLTISPSGESMLVDTGYPGERDAMRIVAAAKDAGLSKIDSVVTSHYHRDHVGGLAALAKMIPIGRYFDHGDTVERPADRELYEGYKVVAAGKRTIVRPGDRIPMSGLQALVVASDGKVLESSVNGGGPNPLCANAERKAPAGGENERTVGLLLTHGKFTFLNLIDLDWERDMAMACPNNLFGKVTMYQTSRHGSFDGAGAPAFLGAIQPQVVIANNGPRKGLGNVDDRVRSLTPPGVETAPYERVAYLRLANLPGIEGIWQIHRSLLDPDPNHNTAENMIANLGETENCEGHWIKASVEPDGRFTITNGRNGFSKTYAAR